MINLLIFSIIAFSAPNRSSHYTCSLQLTLSPNESVAQSKNQPKNQAKHQANLGGKGVASCKNESGFQFNLPAELAISLNSEEQINVQMVRASVEPVSVDHDVNKIFDQYTPHVELKQTPPSGISNSSERSIVVKGDKHDVLLQVNLSLPQDARSKVDVSKVSLKFDR